ncbi:similar to Saccharomyces cerevisiae YPL242C IQG1 Essential protein required for determination of budding pattern [Maudiozyma saulgeensis]|uniref:Similar to Saccharomyces cerevisiae YPL242C IQG1 Essential protein required for determination of budding pattern n=1 Tax=Maudiozyma saulgeensis TaxID=1789683 RepID=A0A1X7R7G6_9SACH|nr:similar to Saccharomyces cerevisiae YPL242C IQG1 Essential protein required for determination of budding pattern [Kazachstania saulgeensis]
MDTLRTSPVSTKLSPFIDRYIQSTNHESYTPNKKTLIPLSPSKMNLAYSPPVTPTKIKSSNLSSPLKFHSYEDKENSKSLSRSPVLKNLHESTLIHSPDEATRKTVSTLEAVDLVKFSNTELKYYEFLCRVAEEKRWIENLIGQSLPSEIELCTGDSLRNGVYLAQVTQVISPQLAPSIFPAGRKLQFKHTQNINTFLSLVDHVGVPDSFRFELQDLYNKKDMPRVIETIHILITMINRKWPGKTTNIENLSGKVSFSKEELRKCHREWPRIRDFKSLAAAQLSSSKDGHSKLSSPGLIQDFSKFDHLQKKNSLTPPVTPTKNRISQQQQIPTNGISENAKEVNQKETEQQLTSSKISTLENNSNKYFSPTFKSADLDTPRLQYSPLKNTSLSYYSPTISNYLTYDSDFYLRRSQNRATDLQYYDNHGYNSPQYSPKRKQKMTEHEFLDQVIQIQNRCRSVNIRFDLFMQERLLKLFERDIVSFQAHGRGAILRRSLNISCRKNLKPEIEGSISTLQSIIKGNKMRYKYDKLRIQCMRNEHIISKFQVIAAGVQIRIKTNRELHNVSLIKKPLTLLQSYLRGIYIRNELFGSKFHDDNKNENLVKLQSFIKGNLTRQNINMIIARLNTSDVHKIQSILNASVKRQQVDNLFKTLSLYEKTITQFSAVMRGNHVRKSLHLICSEKINKSSEIPKIQGIVRGILVRYTLDLVDSIIEVNNITELQGFIKGSQVRLKLHNRENCFIENEKSIVKIQSKVRKHLQSMAYQELMDFPNPSLWAVKKFTHLLNDCGTIEGVQNSLETCQASLDAENLRKHNTQRLLREQLEMLEILDGYGLNGSMSNTDFLSDLNAASSKYSNFEELFYLLQVNPSYWKIMYKQNPDFVENNVYLTFTTLNKKMGKREKTYYIRLLSEVLQYSMSSFKTISDFLVSYDQGWETQLRLFLQREYSETVSLIVPLIDFVDNPRTDFESNPYHIYERLHHCQVPSGLSPIDDLDVKNAFISNLKNIWHCVELVADIYTKQFAKIPVEVRFICTKIFGFAADKNADEIDSIRSVSKVLIDCFIGEYLENLHHYGFTQHVPTQTKRKVEIVLDAVRTVFEMRKFDGYLDPLNQYAEEIKPHIRNIMYNVMIEPDYEQEGDRLIYKDMVSNPPRLEILAEKAKEIYERFIECSNSFPDKDIIQDILKMGSNWKSFPKSGRIYLQLNASVYRFLVSDDQMRKLYDQVKRAIIYMTQIEEVDTNLYDLVVSNILSKDEPLFKKFLEENKIIQRDPLIKNLDPCTYFKLKNVTLKKIHDLESAGVMSSTDNKLQNLLNDIANTIKNPNYAIDYVTQELDTTRNTLKQLYQMNQNNDQILNNLRQTVQSVIRNSQKSHNYLPVNKGTLGNLKSAYKNLQHKNGTELNGLKFKWTTRQLYERGVVTYIDGEKLGEQTIKVFGSSGPKFPDIMFKMSTSDGARYGIQLIDKRKSTENKHNEVVDSFTFVALIKSQAGEKVKKWNILNSKVTVDTSKLLKLVVDTFLS